MTETNTDRIVGHSLQNLFRNGKIFIYDVPLQVPSQDPSQPPQMQVFKEVFMRPDLRMFDAYNKSRLAVLEKYKDVERKGTYESLQHGHRNMLKNAVLSFYQVGHRRQAQKIYNQLRELYPLPEFKEPVVESYVRKRFREELENISLNDAKEIVVMTLRESYFRYAMRDDDEAFGRENLAKEVWNLYQSQYSDENRINLDDLGRLRYFALLDFLDDRQYPPNLRSNLLGRIKIERPELFKLLEAEEEKLRKQSEQSK